jgi:hypothetical protein
MNKLCQISAMFQLCCAVELMSTGRRAVVWWQEGRKKLGRNCALQKVFLRLVGHERKEFADGRFTYVQW